MATTLLNQLRCLFGSGNMGRGTCDIEKGAPIGGIALPYSFSFSDANLQTESAFQAAIAAASIADEYNDRIFGVKTFVGVTDTGEAPEIQTLPNKTKRRIWDSRYGSDYQMIEGKFYHKALKTTLDNRQAQYRWIEVTNQGDGTYAVWFCRPAGTTGGRGYTLSQLNVGRYMGNDYSKGGEFMLSVGLADNNEVDKDWGVIILDSNPLDSIVGLMSVLLSATSASATAIHVNAVTTWGMDMMDDYATELAQVALWSVKNRKIGSTDYGDAITVSAASASGGGINLTIAASGTDPDNPGSGFKVGVSWVSPSAASILTAPLVGFESDEAIVTLG